jgi:hypothetical protein
MPVSDRTYILDIQSGAGGVGGAGGAGGALTDYGLSRLRHDATYLMPKTDALHSQDAYGCTITLMPLPTGRPADYQAHLSI